MVGSCRGKIFVILAVLAALWAAVLRLVWTAFGAVTAIGTVPWVSWLLSAALLAACIGALAGAASLLERWVWLPASRLRLALLAMASGNWDERLELQGPPQVRDLCAAFNRAAEAVASSVGQARAEKAFSEALLTSLPVGILALDRDLRILTCNEAFSRMLRVEPSTLEGRGLAQVLPCAQLQEKARKALEDGQPREGIFACLEEGADHADGSGPRRLNLMVQPVYGAAASERGVQLLVVAEDVTERERSREERDRVASILEATTDFVITTDPEGRVRYVNRAARQALGITAGAVGQGASILSWYPEEERDLMRRERIPQAIRAGVWSGESILKAADGSTIPVSQVMLAHRDGDGNVSFLSLILRDISDRKDLESRLSYLADHDPLTGLFNRRRFEQELERALTQGPHSKARGALLFIDLDNFKFINDEFGHPVGDEILQSTARVLRSRLDGRGILSRLGGDEFMVILPDAGAAEAAAVAEHLLEGMRHGVLQMGSRLVRLSASIGGVLFPEHGVTVEGLLARADRAMYRAKKQGKNAYALFSPYQDWPEPIRMNALWERRIRQALRRDRFLLFAQPIVDVRTGEVFCHELLLRMRDEHGILVPPSRFLGVAEQSDLIHHIDRWVVRKAIQFLGEHRDAGYRLEVNLSGKAFLDDELLELIRRELASSGADPEQLIFEITETSAVMDVDRAKSLITTLRSLGCAFALDDFGAGFSSFFHLKHLPVDYLKIDGSFIQNLPKDKQNQHIVRAMVEAARGSNMLTVAEFVDDAVTIELLREIGVDYVQGYYVGAPRPLSDLKAVRSAR